MVSSQYHSRTCQVAGFLADSVWREVFEELNIAVTHPLGKASTSHEAASLRGVGHVDIVTAQIQVLCNLVGLTVPWKLLRRKVALELKIICGNVDALLLPLLQEW